jgi:hypothetical protein
VKKLIDHIEKLLLGSVLVVLFGANAMAQKPVLHFMVDQCETLEFSVVDMPGDRYTWSIYRDSTVNFAQVDGDVDPVIYFENGMYEGSTVRVNWLEPGRYFVRVMVYDETICTNNLLMYMIDVLEYKPNAELLGDSLCIGEPAEVKVIFSGRGPWDITYTYGDGTNIVNLTGIVEPELSILVDVPSMPGTTDVWIMEVTDQCTVRSYPVPQKVGVTILPKPTNSRIYLKE